MRKILVFTLFLSLTFVFSGGYAANSSQKEVRKAAKKAVETTSKDLINHAFQKIKEGFLDSIKEVADEEGVDGETLAELLTEAESIVNVLLPEALADFNKEADKIFAKYFTVAELNEMNKFYTSPIGQKTLKVMPQLVEEIVMLLIPKLDQLDDAIDQIIEKIHQNRNYTVSEN